MHFRTITGGLLVAALAGCGTTPQERTITGTGLGAGLGAAIGAITGAGLVTSTLVGATSGALTGALTRPDQVNLGDPIWNQRGQSAPISQVSPEHAPRATALVNSIQTSLNRLGYDAGPVDGVVGTRTQRAIRAYQRDHGLQESGRASPQLADYLWSRINTYSAQNRQPG